MPPERARGEFDLSVGRALLENTLLICTSCGRRLSLDVLLDPLLNPRTFCAHDELQRRSFKLNTPPPDVLALHLTCTLQLTTREERRFQPSSPFEGNQAVARYQVVRIGPREL